MARKTIKKLKKLREANAIAPKMLSASKVLFVLDEMDADPKEFSRLYETVGCLLLPEEPQQEKTVQRFLLAQIEETIEFAVWIALEASLQNGKPLAELKEVLETDSEASNGETAIAALAALLAFAVSAKEKELKELRG